MANLKTVSQLELGIEREFQPDRNHSHGGRSFYFFDLDDNVLFLTTTIFIFHKQSGEEIALSTAEFALASGSIGQRGPYKNYEVRIDDQTGSFRRFRDQIHIEELSRVLEHRQPFVEDLASALGVPDFTWKGPSWHCFYHASFNLRPMSVITARGHHPQTIRDGLSLLVSEKHLPREPNYLSVIPVSHPEVRKNLGDSNATWSVSRLKKAAIAYSVYEAMRAYGFSPYHRFGMSDDSPENVELITEAMRDLKREFPHNSFFVIDTHEERYMKQEVFVDHVERSSYPSMTQLHLFNQQF